MQYSTLWLNRPLQQSTMPAMGLQMVPDVGHAVAVVDGLDWDTAVPLCGRRPVGSVTADPDRDFAVVPLAARCAECTARFGQPSSLARRC